MFTYPNCKIYNHRIGTWILKHEMLNNLSIMASTTKRLYLPYKLITPHMVPYSTTVTSNNEILIIDITKT